MSKKEIAVAPDYSAYDDKFDFYAYSSVNKDGYRVNKVHYSVGEDMFTVERFQEYKDCGFTVIMPQTMAVFPEDRKKALDMARQVGLKVLLTDNFFLDLARIKDDFIGEEGRFPTQEAFEKEAKARLEEYIHHPAFYGVIVADEASSTLMDGNAYRRVYRTLRKLYPDLYIHANIRSAGGSYEYKTQTARGKFPALPDEFVSAHTGVALGDPNFQEKVDAYLYGKPSGAERDLAMMPLVAERFRLYCEKFLATTDAPFITMDAYPLYESGPMSNYILAMQVMAEVCKSHGVDFHVVTQSMSLVPGGNVNRRVLSKYDLDWLNNGLLAFGCRHFGYFTYFIHESYPDEYFPDGTAFMTRYGEKTHIWYHMQKVFANNQKFAPTFFRFRYVTSKTYVKEECKYPNYFAVATHRGEFSQIEKVEWDREFALITESYDKENDRYMYAIMNIIDPQHQAYDTFESIEVTFAKRYQNARVYRAGEFTDVPLEKGKYACTLRPGEAVYVIPY